MSFRRHEEIYPCDQGAIAADRAPAHRVDEFPTGYSWRVALQQSPLPLYQPDLCCNLQPPPHNARPSNGGMRLTACLSRRVHSSSQFLSSQDEEIAPSQNCEL